MCRPLSTELGIIESVRQRCLDAGEQDPLDEAASLRLKNHGLEGSSLWLAGHDGFAFQHGRAVELAVAPEARRQGLGRQLAEQAFAGTAPVAAWSHGDHPAAARLAAAYGLERARELWVMRRATKDWADLEPPAGITVRHYRAEDADEVLRVNAAAFDWHPEQGAMDDSEMRERMAEPWFDPSGLIVADAGDRLVGFHWTKIHSADVGEIYVIAADPSAQGMGLGRVLVAAGLRHLAAAGVAEIMLFVESDNLAGRGLYEGLGFTHAAADTHVQYQRTASGNLTDS